jgi:hypothetical protein
LRGRVRERGFYFTPPYEGGAGGGNSTEYRTQNTGDRIKIIPPIPLIEGELDAHPISSRGGD